MTTNNPWIKIQKSKLQDARVLRMVRALCNASALPSNAPTVTENEALTKVLGGLVRMWMYADSFARDDDTAELTVDDVDQISGVQGFGEILPSDWFQILDPQTVEFPKYHTHNGTEARKKDLSNLRVARYRKRELADRGNAPDTQRNALALPSNETALPDQDLDLDKDQDPEKEKEEEKKRHVGPAARRVSANPKVSDEQFAELQSVYPQRTGLDQRWPEARSAINARLAEGATWNELLKGARRYAAYCRAEGTEPKHVRMAATFYGRSRGYLTAWNPPSKGELLVDQNIETSLEWYESGTGSKQ